ncbi:MAG TPA: response regulator [Thermomicrobiaceae bacterium]|nr:response regulator [Thermomicrobiaceae bacterium]
MTIVHDDQTALVVEDDQGIADLICWILRDAGFRVYTAATVAAALECADRVRPDLVVADLILPDGLGSELVVLLRRYAVSRPATLMMSAHPQAKEHAERAGADACLPKPFDLDDFYDTVNLLTDHAQQAG